MNVRKILIALLIVIASVALLALAGCAGAKQGEEIVKDANALDQLVTYYANGGMFDGKDGNTQKNLHFQVNSPVISDFSQVSNISIERDGYEFNGWYYVQCENGEPVLNADNQLILTTPVDFTVKIQQGEHWYIAANWLPVIKLEIKLATDDKGAMTASDGTKYENGSIISTRSFTNGYAVMDMSTPVKSSDYTFTQLFHDAECTQPVLANIARPVEEGAENPVVYAQYLKGDWAVVRTASDVEDMFFAPAGRNFWICTMTEEKVINCSTISIPLRQNAFSGRIEGNGYTLSGITVTAITDARDSKYSLFGPLDESCTVRNLTLENLSLNVTSSREIYVYLITSEANGATLENFTVTNATLNISAQNGVRNIGSNGNYTTTNWIFGGVENSNGEQTDSAFLEQYSSVAVQGGTLIINKTEFSYGN